MVWISQLVSLPLLTHFPSSSLAFSLLGSPSFGRSFGTDQPDLKWEARELPNGDLVMSLTSDLGSRKDFFLFCLDSRGLVKWNKRVGFANSIRTDKMAVSNDGSFALGGWS